MDGYCPDGAAPFEQGGHLGLCWVRRFLCGAGAPVPAVVRIQVR
eukprot:SAG22_NODE_18379_length_288_cov_1.037037_1_plen_43_part_01